MSEELKELQKNEALNRLRILQMKYELLENVVKEADDTIYYSEYINQYQKGLLYWIDNEDAFVDAIKRFEEKHQSTVYHAIYTPTSHGRILSLLYVSPHQEEWKMDRDDLNDDGRPLAYCINLDDDTASELGAIQIERAKGGINRRAEIIQGGKF